MEDTSELTVGLLETVKQDHAGEVVATLCLGKGRNGRSINEEFATPGLSTRQPLGKLTREKKVQWNE